jgi:hypothetical protein
MDIADVKNIRIRVSKLERKNLMSATLLLKRLETKNQPEIIRKRVKTIAAIGDLK